MSQIKRKCVGASICFFMLSFAWGQGCSDAGFCTLHPIKPTNQLDSSGQFRNKIAFGVNRGLGDFGIFVSTAYIDYTRFVGKKWSLNAKLTGLVANGELATTAGFSDVYINANYTFTPQLKGTLGLKVPLNSGNLHQDGLPLPMNYQTSLGT